MANTSLEAMQCPRRQNHVVLDAVTSVDFDIGVTLRGNL